MQRMRIEREWADSIDATEPASRPARTSGSGAGTRAASPRAALGTEAGSTDFRSTLFDALGPVDAARAAASRSVFDVCHVGVLLRALLLVHAVVAIGVLFVAASPAAWLLGVAMGASIALPGVLIWLLVACGLKRMLGAWPAPAQWAAAIALGAASGAVAARLPWLLGGDPLGAPGWLAPAFAGAGMAAAMFLWLRQRERDSLPAEAAARLAELQSRIRPHFLFNTLNTALALVRVDPARAERVLEDLAELFRVAISDSAESVSLSEEVQLAQRYIAIEQIRFGERLKVHWELDAAAGAARLPPLLLQPLVENAVRHGIEPADAGGVIRVRTRVRHGRAWVSIVNSVSDTPSRPGHGIALRNVRERLRLMHDVSAQFETRREAGVFRVQIVVPL